jgi:hypothetical protein
MKRKSPQCERNSPQCKSKSLYCSSYQDERTIKSPNSSRRLSEQHQSPHNLHTSLNPKKIHQESHENSPANSHLLSSDFKMSFVGGRYKLSRKIGEGSFSAIYEAVDKFPPKRENVWRVNEWNGSAVALKIAHDSQYNFVLIQV